MEASNGTSETKGRRHTHHPEKGGLLIGGALVILGVGFLLAKLGRLGGMSGWQVWPLILVWAGLLNLVGRGRVSEKIWGLALIVGGGAGMAHYLGAIELAWSIIWPALLVFAGLMILGSALFRSSTRRKSVSSARTTAGSTVEAFVMFGGREEKVESRSFSGGQIQCVMGGYELDLRQARMEDDEATLDITAIMGGVEIRVPTDWTVSVRGTPILGAFEDKSGPTRTEEGSPSHRLVVAGTVIMGGVEITN
jgi:predicted membrane protein